MKYTISIIFFSVFWMAGCTSSSRLPIADSDFLPPADSNNHKEVIEKIRKKPQLTLAETQLLIFSSHPRMQAAAQEIYASYGRSVQAGLWSNPRLGLEIENLGGSEGGFNGSEATVFVSQNLPLNGALGLTTLSADKETEMARTEYEQEKLNLLSEAYLAFYQVLLARERQRQLVILHDSAKVFAEKVKKAVELGKKPRIDMLKAEVAETIAQAQTEQAKSSLQSEQKNLASLLSIPLESIPFLHGDIFPQISFSDLPKLREKLQKHPEMEKIRLQRQQWSIEKRIAQAQRWPDIEVEIGARRNYAANENTLVVGFGIDLPLFNRNQGRIAELDALSQKIIYRMEAKSRDIENELFTSYRQYQASKIKASKYLNKVLPAAKESLALAKEGYLQGKFPALEVIDAQETQARAYLDFLETLGQFHQAVASIYRLTGTTVEPFAK